MKSVGILGGGQLAKLLSLSAKNLDLKVWVLSPSKQDPAGQNNPYWIKGDPHSLTDLKKFLTNKDILSFESEFFSAKQIKKALKPKSSLFIAPSLNNLKNIQDRAYQKKLLKKHHIPTTDFVPVEFKTRQSGQKKLLNLWSQWGAFVLKSRMGGYDGYGTFVIKKKSHIKQIKLPQTNFIAEKLIPFKRELALLSARNKKGQIVFFPLVESFQEKSTCLWVKGPAQHKKLKSLKTQIKKFLSHIDYQGVIAFELFDTHSNLIVNELAPRVHNTGHYSLDALTEDQFSLHLKAISNQTLKTPRLKYKAFAMLNLLGEGAKKPSFKKRSLLDKACQSQLYRSGLNFQHDLFRLPPEDRNSRDDSHSRESGNLRKKQENSNRIRIKKEKISLYWYGKTESRIGRKMGHLNSAGSSGKQALNKLLKLRPFFKI
ncbi:MAG: ATP-grasp domain-containing protein [Oligoflexia bacterium]|nr:ATP-grasp domain-containing protein [Oligoflexia bacterium]